MDINLNVKIKAGKRTPPNVKVYATSISHEKIITFTNGKTISETEIASWIERELTRALKTLEAA